MADILRDAVKSCGKSLRELGREADVDATVISRFMKEKQGITFETACRLLDALGLEIRPAKKKPDKHKGN